LKYVEKSLGLSLLVANFLDKMNLIIISVRGRFD